MTTPMSPSPMSASGTVTGAPGLILRAEGAAILAVAATAYGTLGFGWWLFALMFLVPDLFMAGYLAGPRVGAWVYNLGHTTLLPLALAAAGWAAGGGSALALGLIWLAHVGFDRLAGYGLKCPDAFRHTHLG